MSNSYKTHEKFFKVITRRKLNELLYRADEETKFLENEINQEISQIYPDVIAKSKVSDPKSKMCSLYIEFKRNNIKLGHISFHLYPESVYFTTRKNNINKQLGRLHCKNNRNKQCVQVIQVNNSNDDSITFRLIAYKSFARDPLKTCINKTIKILEDYFYDQSPNFLGKHYMPELETNPHPCFPIIEQQFKINRKSTPLHNTRKVKRTY